jgi:hypothetical protein
MAYKKYGIAQNYRNVFSVSAFVPTQPQNLASPPYLIASTNKILIQIKHEDMSMIFYCKKRCLFNNKCNGPRDVSMK